MISSISIKPFLSSKASVTPPGSKSITNRAMILSALKGGRTLIKGALFSRDTAIMSDCLSKLGYTVIADKENKTIEIIAKSCEIPNSSAELNVGNAGTSARFITAFLALKKGGNYLIDSDEAMYSRPIKGLIDALKSQGAEFEFLKKENFFPFRIKTCGLKGGEIQIDAGQSSQMLSAILMATVSAESKTTVKLTGQTVSKPFVDMTLNMMRQFGFDCSVDGSTYFIDNNKNTDFLLPEYLVEPDATASSYFSTLPAVVGGMSEIVNFATCKLQGDAKYINVLESIGLVDSQQVEDNLLVFSNQENIYPDFVEVDFNDISDTFLSLAGISMLLPFKLKITGIEHTRHQETDRVSAVATELKKFCANVEENSDDITITPYPINELASKIDGKVLVKTYEDHRIAMSFAIAGCADIRGNGSPWIEIEDPKCTSKTWADFFEVLDDVRENSQKMRVVAIDGGAAVGKSSVSKECSKILNYMHVDTGAHYRTLTFGLLNNNIDASDNEAIVKSLSTLNIGSKLQGNSAKLTIDSELIAEENIRNETINANVANFAAIPQVREFLKNYQRSMVDFAAENGYTGLIMEGRDIGSVIFPDANARIFLDADEATREARRANEGISDSIKERDKLDRTRKTAPLICPEGATLIDTSHMSKQEVVAKTLSVILQS